MWIDLEGFSWTKGTTGMMLLPGVSTGVGTAFKPCVGSAYMHSLGLHASPVAHSLDS